MEAKRDTLPGVDISMLATPHLEDGDDAFASMSRTYWRGVIQQITNSSDDNMPASLLHTLRQSESARLHWRVAWRPEVGIALERVSRSQYLAAGIQVAMLLHTIGIEGRWEAGLSNPVWFLFGNEFIQIQGCIEARMDDSGCLVRFNDGMQFKERRFVTETSAKDSSIGPPACGSEVPPWVDPQSAANCNAWSLQDTPLRPVSDPSVVGPTWLRTIELLERHAPEYLRWIQRAITRLMPVASDAEQTYSGSQFARPGLVVASFPMHPVQLGEALVHEASHQHFYLGAVFVSYCEMSHARYFSPINQRHRPLIAVLMAYHAVANSVLYYARLLSGGTDPDTWCSTKLKYLNTLLQEYERTLRELDDQLTDTGRTLCRLLQERVALVRTQS